MARLRVTLLSGEEIICDSFHILSRDKSILVNLKELTNRTVYTDAIISIIPIYTEVSDVILGGK